MTSVQENRWATPKAIDRVSSAFPANVVGTYLPPSEEIPEEFHRNWFHGSDVWTATANEWFSNGLNIARFKPKDGIDANTAWRHLGACMRSFEPKHEHKIAGVAWLMSLWFEVSA